jgi:hypothetical protein
VFFAVVLAALAIGALGVGWRVTGRWRRAPGDPVAARARNPGIGPLTPGPAARTARRLRPSLAGTSPADVTAADTGLHLGDLMTPGGRGVALYASWENTIAGFMAPRSGKTTALAE